MSSCFFSSSFSPLVPLLLAVAVFCPDSGAQQLASGYESDTLSVAPGSVFVGGFCVLPNNNYALYDGTDVLELSPLNGVTVRVLYTPINQPFGGFLRLDPSGSLLYFGESSFGTIREIRLSDLSVRTVATVVTGYDLDFDPQGRAFLSWSPGFGQGSKVSLLDLTTGNLLHVVDSLEATGPVACDTSGGLYYGFPDTTSFPPPPDQSRVVYYNQAQLDAVIAGGAQLQESDGIQVGRVDGAAAFALDDAGDLFVSDNAYNSITELDLESGDERIIFDGADFRGVTYLDFRAADPGHAFEAYQRPGSGELVGIATDYVSFNDALRIRPQRAQLSTVPSGPIPPGSFDLVLDAGPADGSVLLLVTGGLQASEFRGSNASWPAPLWWGLDFTGGLLLFQTFGLDATGGVSLNANNPGLAGLSLGLQGVVGEGSSGPFYGTTQPFELVLQ